METAISVSEGDSDSADDDETLHKQKPCTRVQ